MEKKSDKTGKIWKKKKVLKYKKKYENENMKK